jgi:hypothetical protein
MPVIAGSGWSWAPMSSVLAPTVAAMTTYDVPARPARPVDQDELVDAGRRARIGGRGEYGAGRAGRGAPAATATRSPT